MLGLSKSLRSLAGAPKVLATSVRSSGFPATPPFFLAPSEPVFGTSLIARSAGSFFQSSYKSAELWKAVTSVSNQGRQRGRAKGLAKIKNLNRGQKLGMGKARVVFPGLTAPAVTKDRTRKRIGQMDEAKFNEYTDTLEEIRSKMAGKRGLIRRQTPLQRGWTGNSPQGRKFGPPISVNPEYKFENFDSILIEYRTIIGMNGVFGRTRKLRLIMVVGNRNGLAGMAMVTSPTGRGPYTFQRAVNKAGLRLCFFPRYEDRTVYHDFFTNFGSTRIIVRQKPSGHGVDAHRVIKAICEMIGIKDLHCDVEGSRSYNHIAKAFLLGLLRQRTHQELANEKKLHLVEFREEIGNFPKVVASPEDGYVRTKEEIEPTEILDFETISFDGNLVWNRVQPKPFYEQLNIPSWQKRCKKTKPQEHHFQQRLQMLVEKGRECSQFTDIFPECLPISYYAKAKKASE